MRSAEGKIGRVFILRLEDGDKIPCCIEKFALEKEITVAHVMLLGGVDEGDIVVGPRKSRENPPNPMLLPLDGVHEIVASGIVAPDKENRPILHIHGSMGRSGHTVTGCLREGASVWLVCEAVILEILGTNVKRIPEKESGFLLLDIDE